MSKGGCDRWKRTCHRGRSPDAGAPGSTPAPEAATSQGQKLGALCPYPEFSLKGVVGAELAKGWMECAGMSVFPQHHPFPLRSLLGTALRQQRSLKHTEWAPFLVLEHGLEPAWEVGTVERPRVTVRGLAHMQT